MRNRSLQHRSQCDTLSDFSVILSSCSAPYLPTWLTLLPPFPVSHCLSPNFSLPSRLLVFSHDLGFASLSCSSSSVFPEQVHCVLGVCFSGVCSRGFTRVIELERLCNKNMQGMESGFWSTSRDMMACWFGGLANRCCFGVKLAVKGRDGSICISGGWSLELSG